MSSKLREAVEKIYNEAKECDEGGEYLGEGPDPGFARIMKMCEAALAEPIRNCDVGTAEEQEVRFRNYCWNHSSKDKNMECQCPIDTEGKAGCKLEWSQLPYESEVKQ